MNEPQKPNLPTPEQFRASLPPAIQAAIAADMANKSGPWPARSFTRTKNLRGDGMSARREMIAYLAKCLHETLEDSGSFSIVVNFESDEKET